MNTAPVPGAVDLARSLAIDLARQHVLKETASSKSHQQKLDQAFSAIKAFEHSHSVTPLHDYQFKGSSNDLDKISVAANIRRNSSSNSLGSIPGSPNASFTGKHMLSWVLPAAVSPFCANLEVADRQLTTHNACQPKQRRQHLIGYATT